MTVKRNQPDAYDEIVESMGRLSEECSKSKEGGNDQVPSMEGQKEKYEEISSVEKNRDRYKYREIKACKEGDILSIKRMSGPE